MMTARQCCTDRFKLNACRCKQPGHTTATCRHRIAPEHGCVQAASSSQHNMLGSIVQRQQDGRWVAAYLRTAGTVLQCWSAWTLRRTPDLLHLWQNIIETLYDHVLYRQRETVMPEQRWQVEAAVLKLLTRRCTCLEFHPSRDNIVLAGDKKGMIAVWDFEKVKRDRCMLQAGAFRCRHGTDGQQVTLTEGHQCPR